MQSKLYLIFLTFKIYKWDRTTIRYVLSQICIRNIVISWFKSWGQEVWNKWLSCLFSIKSLTKDPGDIVPTLSGIIGNSHYLTESEFCPPEQHQHTVCAIKSNFLTSCRVSDSPVPTPTQSTHQRNIRGDRVPTLSGMIGNSHYWQNRNSVLPNIISMLVVQ